MISFRFSNLRNMFIWKALFKFVFDCDVTCVCVIFFVLRMIVVEWKLDTVWHAPIDKYFHPVNILIGACEEWLGSFEPQRIDRVNSFIFGSDKSNDSVIFANKLQTL